MHVINILNNCNCAWLVAGLLLYTYFLCYEEDKEGGGGGGGVVSHLPTLNISIAN